MAKKILFIAIGALVLLGAAIQFVPVSRTNPPVTQTLNWSSPETKALWVRACADCHSNETVWPPYAYVAPVSWLVSRNVTEGRRELNLSQPLRGQPARVANEISEKITSGEMPPRDFILMHPEAVLSTAEKRTLIDGLRATLGGR
jgi:hypothetical protein